MLPVRLPSQQIRKGPFVTEFPGRDHRIAQDQTVRPHQGRPAVCLPGFPEMADYVMENAQEGDLVLTLGCGDVYKCARMMLLK